MLKQSISDSDGLPHIKGIESIATNSMSAKKVKLLHVLLVTETWLPEVNGVAMSLGQLMHQLNLKGHQISLLRPKPNHSSALCNSSESYFQVMQDISHDLQVKGVSIPKYKELQFGAPVYFKIKKHFQQLQPDVVHIATEGPLGLAALWAAKTLNITVTTGYHTQFHDFSRHFGLGILARPMMAYFKWFHNASQATCVPSQKTFHDLDALGFKRLYEVGRGVDLERFNPIHRSEALRAKWGAHSQHTVLLMVSRLSPEKGVDLVIKSFKALQQEQLHRVVKLVIVGDGPDKERLESLAAGNKEDIIFAGAQTGKDLSEHYASADVFVFASQVETFGNVVVEAMA
ncbi:MAG TPA: glycosyltransferase family 1 protein, partial [Psychrobacter sp.]|nr:glycosyltransferase family 1 protein [Psychrobacter sp.]